MTTPGSQGSAPSVVNVRVARREDAHRIFEIIDECAASGAVLPRTIENIALTIESFFVGEVNGRVMGCAALVTCGPAMAEVRSVATSEEARGLGVARAVVEYIITMAHALEFERLFLLTKIPGFFEKLGFASVDPESLPDSFIADVVHTQRRSLFNKSVMMKNLSLDAHALSPTPARAPKRKSAPRQSAPKPGAVAAVLPIGVAPAVVAG